MTRKIVIKYILAIVVCLLMVFVAFVAAQTSYQDWYLQLEKSAVHAPESIFAPIWVILYVLMGIATGIVWSRGFYHKWVQVAIYHFGFTLVLSAFWFILFFGLQKPLYALLDAVLLLVVLLVTFKWYRIVNKVAAYLLIPHVIWLIYIGILNYEIWRLN